jgi:hypothetical protein
MDNSDESWDCKYKLLIDFVQNFDRFPKGDEEHEGVAIGAWLSYQRAKFKNGELDPRRMNMLESIGLEWMPLEESWESKYSLLLQFISEFKCFPKHAATYHEINLGYWCTNQRVLFSQGDLEQKRVDRLESIGFEWKIRDRQDWFSRFELLRSFISEFNRWPAHDEEYQDFRIGAWCFAQRQLFKTNGLKKERIEQLNSIGFSWEGRYNKETRNDEWASQFELLCSFLAEYNRFPTRGHAGKEDGEYRGFKIAVWCANQRAAFRRGKLDEHRATQLESIGFELKPVDLLPPWDFKFEIVCSFIAEFKRLPRSDEEHQGFKIGSWCAVQRHRLKNSKLSQEQITQLESIGFETKFS